MFPKLPFTYQTFKFECKYIILLQNKYFKIFVKVDIKARETKCLNLIFVPYVNEI